MKEINDLLASSSKSAVGSALAAGALGIADPLTAVIYGAARPVITETARMAAAVGGAIGGDFLFRDPSADLRTVGGTIGGDLLFRDPSACLGALLGASIGYSISLLPTIYLGSKVAQQLLGVSLGLKPVLALETAMFASRIFLSSTEERARMSGAVKDLKEGYVYLSPLALLGKTFSSFLSSFPI